MFFSKKTYIIPAFLIGLAVGGMSGAAGMLATDKNRCKKMKTQMGKVIKRMTHYISDTF